MIYRSPDALMWQSAMVWPVMSGGFVNACRLMWCNIGWPWRVNGPRSYFFQYRFNLMHTVIVSSWKYMFQWCGVFSDIGCSQCVRGVNSFIDSVQQNSRRNSCQDLILLCDGIGDRGHRSLD